MQIHPNRSFIGFTRTAVPLVLTFAFTISSCGGSGDKTVATVGKTKLSQATLSHWMTTTLGGDYRTALGATAPEGLVSDPADYARCVSVARGIVPQAGGRPAVSDAQLRIKCRQLNEGIKQQALDYVLSVLWAIEEGNEVGSPASEEEVTRRMNQLAQRDYHGPVQFRKTLVQLRRTVADERLLVKRNILQVRYMERLKKRAAQLGGGEKAVGKLVLENNAKWTARTKCAPGYLAWECSGYGSFNEVSPPPAVVLEQLANGVR